MAANASDSPHLGDAEQEQADDHAPLRPLVIHEIVRAEGKAELERPVAALAWSGLAAGMSMGFSFMAQALLRADIAPGPGRDAISSLGYMLGFVIVVLGRQQLFTESTLTAALPALHDSKLKTWGIVLRLWVVVLVANLAGTWIFATMLAVGHPLPPVGLPALAELSRETLAHPFWNTLLRSVLAGWLIALMVWLLPSAGTARILIIGLLTWLVAFAKLSHIIAGSTEAAYAVLKGEADFGGYAWKFLIPTLIGNTLGGVSLVAMLNHAPISEDVDAEGDDQKDDTKGEAAAKSR